MTILTDEFSFIKPDVTLSPWVDTDTRKQKIIPRKQNRNAKKIEMEESKDCIRTAISFS